MSLYRDPKGDRFSKKNYDSNGRRTVNYDRKGRIIGYSEKNSAGGYTHYDNHGKEIGSSGYGNYSKGSSGEYRRDSCSCSRKRIEASEMWGYECFAYTIEEIE